MIAPPATLPRLAGLRLGDRWADSWRAAALLLAVVAASLAGVWRSAEAALEQASFAQAAGAGDKRQLDALLIAPLREHAHLASVSVAPNGDGYVRRMPLDTLAAGTPRPALASFIAGRAGAFPARSLPART